MHCWVLRDVSLSESDEGAPFEIHKVRQSEHFCGVYLFYTRNFAVRQQVIEEDFGSLIVQVDFINHCCRLVSGTNAYR